jgi:hypothetical protein
MDSAKLKKLQDYSVVLTQQAESKEAQGNKNEAVKDYVKLVDVLLILANEAKDHPTWQQLVNRAEFYQKKARTMVDPEQGGSSQKPSNSFETREPPTEKLPASATNEKSQDDSTSESTSSSFNPFRKLSLIGRKSESKGSIGNNLAGNSATATTVISSWSKNDQDPRSLPSSPSQSMPIQSQMLNENEVVSRALYSQLLEEKASLQRQIESLRSREKEFLAAIEEKEKEFSQRISQMVPRSEFEELKKKLADTIPRSQYEEALTFSAIPKERYMELQSQLGELQNKLQNSVSKALIDDLAEYVSFLASTVSSTIQDEETHEENSRD